MPIQNPLKDHGAHLRHFQAEKEPLGNENNLFSVRSEIVITGVGMNSLCNFTKYYSCEISLNVNFKTFSGGKEPLGNENNLEAAS